MSDYLSTLVKKSERLIEDCKVVDDIQSEPEEVLETVTTKEISFNEVETEEKSEAQLNEEALEVVRNDVEKDIIEDDIKLIPGQEYDVKSIRVYNAPDFKQVSRTISGRVVYIGSIEPFDIVKYMKHGFGMVQGYAVRLKENLKK